MSPRKGAAGAAKPARAARAAAGANDFPATYAALAKILDRYESPLLIRAQGKRGFWLNSTKVGPNKYRFAFAGVMIGKGYVSYHLVPVYMNPALKKRISPALEARMQGMACFNFKRPDPVLFKELASLTKAAFQSFRGLGYI